MTKPPTPPLFQIKRSTARQIADQLIAAGIPVHEVSEPDEDVDGNITVTDFVHVQVGFDDCNVGVEASPGSFTFYDPVTSLDQLIRDIHTGIEEARIAKSTASRPPKP